MNNTNEQGGEQQSLADVVPLRPVEDVSLPPLDVRGVADQVFAAWIEATGRTARTMLTTKRRRLIEARYREGYELGDLLDAVRGWQRSPFHRGENPDGKVWNSLELVMRDGEHVEMFRDYWRTPPKPRPIRGRSASSGAQEWYEEQVRKGNA